MDEKQRAFTTKYDGRVNVLKTEVGICLPFLGEPTKEEKLIIEKFTAIWDTGATNCVVTEKVVKKLNLKPIRIAEVYHAAGKSLSNVYLVNIALPSNVIMQGVSVTEGILPEDNAQVLIGMDIISMGDFAVTNVNGKTVLSFRTPAYQEIDFVPEANEFNMKSMNRHDRRKIESLLRRGKIK